MDEFFGGDESFKINPDTMNILETAQARGSRLAQQQQLRQRRQEAIFINKQITEFIGEITPMISDGTYRAQSIYFASDQGELQITTVYKTFLYRNHRLRDDLDIMNRIATIFDTIIRELSYDIPIEELELTNQRVVSILLGYSTSDEIHSFIVEGLRLCATGQLAPYLIMIMNVVYAIYGQYMFTEEQLRILFEEIRGKGIRLSRELIKDENGLIAIIKRLEVKRYTSTADQSDPKRLKPT